MGEYYGESFIAVSILRHLLSRWLRTLRSWNQDSIVLLSMSEWFQLDLGVFRWQATLMYWLSLNSKRSPQSSRLSKVILILYRNLLIGMICIRIDFFLWLIITLKLVLYLQLKLTDLTLQIIEQSLGCRFSISHIVIVVTTIDKSRDSLILY